MKDANVKQLNRLRLWDKAGVVLSGLCLVHCLGIPLLLLISPVIGHELIHQDTIFHKWFFVGVITVAAVAFYLGYRVHNNFRPLIWMLLGISFISVGTFYSPGVGHGSIETLAMILGGISLVRAHLLNHSKKHLQADCSSCKNRQA